MKKTYAALLLPAFFLSVSCAKQPPKVEESTYAAPPDTSAESREDGLLAWQEQYMALIESYLEDTAFKPTGENANEALAERLGGHYDVTGRIGGGMEYYIAVRQKDAPVYDNFSEVNVGYLDENLFVGYYDTELNPVVLYELNGYALLDMPFGYDNLDCLCLGVYEEDGGETDPAFRYVFDQNGRDMLDFLESKPGLSLRREGVSYIQFYYQDEDTVKFSSEPYSCYIPIDASGEEELRRLLSASVPEEGISGRPDALSKLRKKGVLCPTGASLLLDGRRYESFAGRERTGYVLVSTEKEADFLSLEYNEALCRFIAKKVRDVTGMDYESFDPEWFKTPLESASLSFPGHSSSSPAISEWNTQVIEDRERLDALAALMDRALNSGEAYGFSACPYIAPLDFIRGDGAKLRIFIAADSCDSMAYEGRIAFEYGDQAELAAIFDEAMKTGR